MKKIIIILSILLNLKFTTAKESLFLQGNEAYANENYSTAISCYDSILSNGIESSELFYNLGNCYYKTQNWANAIWNYEKALKLNPNNQNASYNLELTKIKTIDQIEALPDLFYKKWWDDLVSLSSTKNWQIFAILSIWIILIIQIFSRFTNGYKPKEHIEKLFNAICNCNGFNPNEINNLSEQLVKSASSLTKESLKKYLEQYPFLIFFKDFFLKLPY